MSISPLTALKRSLITSSALIVFGLTAAASPLSMADANNDGNITYAEFSAVSAQKFTDMDINANGFITDDERAVFRSARQASRAQEKFEKIDANSDGFISNEEFTSAAQERQAKMQTTREARRAERQANKETRRTDKKERRARMKKHRKLMAKNGGRQSPDLNGDGMMDKAEHDALTKSRFERMDKNNDGVLDAGEQKHRKRHGFGKPHGFGQ